MDAHGYKPPSTFVEAVGLVAEANLADGRGKGVRNHFRSANAEKRQKQRFLTPFSPPYQVYIVGLSFDKVCLLMNFFQHLKLRKSQANALLNQLARQWEEEFDLLCLLLANSLVVHTDETGWSINSVWAFLSEKVRVLFFGVHKDAETLRQILDPATFAGIVISDNAAVYANFTQSQKCWAHFLRKAIKLTLIEPANAEYRQFTDRLLEIYREACRVQRDRRLSAEGRKSKVAALDDEIFDLCFPVWVEELPPGEGPEDDYRRLCNELMRVMLAEQPFTFVTAEPVEKPNGETLVVSGTNNEAERTLRSPAQARDTGRTNKTVAGARRQTVIVSVLESLRQHLPTFTLSTVIGPEKGVRNLCFWRFSPFALREWFLTPFPRPKFRASAGDR